MLSTTDRYLLGRILRTLVPTGLGLGFMFFLAAWFRLLKEQDLSLQQILLALPWFVPLLLPYLLPLAFLSALALVYGRMVADNEALAFSALGVRGTSLAAPALVLGAALSVFSAWATADLVPYCYRMEKEALRAVFRELFALGKGEHFSRSFPSQGFDVYVREYDGADWRGVVLRVEVGRSGNDPSRATPVLLVAERATILESESGDLEIQLSGVSATAYPGGRGAFDEAVLAAGELVTRPIRAGADESLMRVTLGGRRRVKERDYASADLRRQVVQADRRTALAGATGGVIATRAGQRDAALALRLELVTRAAISTAPLLLAAILVPLVLLLRARTAVIPLVVGLLASCLFYFVPLLAGLSFAETLALPALGYLGCGVAVLGAGFLAWRAGQVGGGGSAVGRALSDGFGWLRGKLARLRGRKAAEDGDAQPQAEPAAAPTPAPPRRRRPSLGFLRVSLVDRWLAGRLLTTFFLVTSAILIVFVVVDLFSNLEKLSQQGMLRGMALRYGAQIPEIFLTLSPFLLVLAALWVVIDLQRQNELVPLVACGYNPRRLAVPLLAMGLLLAPVVWADRELVLPRVAALEREAESFRSATWKRPRIVPDGEGGVFVARFYNPAAEELRDVSYLKLDAEGRKREAYLALRARPEVRDEGGGWRLEIGEHRTHTADGEQVTPLPAGGLWVPSRVLLADVEAAIEAPGFLSSAQIRQQLERTPGFRHLRMQLYERFTYPLAGLALLSVCLPLLLVAQGGWDTFLRASGSLGVCFAYFVGSTICSELGRHGALPELVAVVLPLGVTAVLAAWMWRE